ncbi:MAG TPA: hypothetical protein VN476_07260 [Pyrinomonadaceae bacterium]|nr:hypothetical protein [Pyrinomonadaceae bacterium]
MKQRPLSITIISWLFIVFGAIALVAGLWPLIHLNGAQLVTDLEKHWMVYLSRSAQIIAGVFMLYGQNWARWLLVVWLTFHVVIGALHSPFHFITHLLLFVVVLFFLFRPVASAYFREKDLEHGHDLQD